MKKIGIATAVTVALAMSGSASAMSVFTDFTGDGIADSMHEMRVGDTASVTVWAQLSADDDAAGGLVSFGTEAELNPTGVVNITAGNTIVPPWFVGPQFSFSPNSAQASGGTIPGVMGNVELFSLDLLAVSMGITMLDLSTFHLSATFDSNVLANGFVLDDLIDYAGAEIKVVPIPAAALLFGSALFGVAGFARRRKA